MKNLYKITKYFKGGSHTYFIRANKITEDILENIGEHTSGGHAYGYNMRSTKIKKLPRGAKLLKPIVTYRLF